MALLFFIRGATIILRHLSLFCNGKKEKKKEIREKKDRKYKDIKENKERKRK
jgi:hypothetical protein